MALFERKPIESLSPAYRRRIEKAEAQGFTRSQARGHAKREELGIREFRLAERPDNRLYLLKRVSQLKDPKLIAQYNEVQRLSKEVQKLPKGSPERERLARERDILAKNLAGKVRDTTPGTDLYPLPSSKSPFSQDFVEADLEAIEESEEE